MNHYSSNAIHTLTNEQRKALAQCLVFKARPAEILLHTKYVLISPLGELELAAEAGQDWLKLHQEGYEVDPITGVIVEIPATIRDRTQYLHGTDHIPNNLTLTELNEAHWKTPADWSPLSGQAQVTITNLRASPFTPAQERRIREIIADVLRGFADSAEEAE